MSVLRQRIFVVKQFWPYFREFKAKLLLIFIIKLSLLVPGLLYPMIYRFFVDNVLAARAIGQLGNVIVFILGLYLLETILKVVHRVFDNYLFNSIAFSLKKTMFNKYMYIPSRKLATYTVSDLKNRIDTDVDMVKIFILYQIFDYLSAFTKLISSFVVLMLFNWYMGLFCVVMLPISIWISNSFGKTLAEGYEQLKQQENYLEQMLQESIHHWKEIKAGNLVGWINEKYVKALGQKFECSRAVTAVLIKRNIVLSIKDTWFNQMLIYILGAILFLFDMITMGTVVMGGQYYSNMYDSLRDMLDLDVGLTSMKPSVDRVYEILCMEVPISSNSLESIFVLAGQNILHVCNLSFQYKTNMPYVFRHLNFTIRKGEKVLLLGESGVGKSTLIGLLSGYLHSTEGEIFLCSQVISKLSQYDIFKKMAIIYQEPYFMNFSVKDFLLLANENAGLESMRRACRRVGLLDFIELLPDGFDTKLGEHGSNFSGGQKQRLSLARLFLNHKDIIILDEAFSAIDGQEKSKILQEIMDDYQEETIICISHDASVSNFFSRRLKLTKGEFIDV
ncbi:MAG: ABC transporter ATP-binding protein [Lachnospiraceae bacterium]|jgi:ATP-binding cassette subfamily B protein|nr:ABC transporter ATP-binding protein [Lachnospiraceae bacterium]